MIQVDDYTYIYPRGCGVTVTVGDVDERPVADGDCMEMHNIDLLRISLKVSAGGGIVEVWRSKIPLSLDDIRRLQ